MRGMYKSVALSKVMFICYVICTVNLCWSIVQMMMFVHPSS